MVALFLFKVNFHLYVTVHLNFFVFKPDGLFLFLSMKGKEESFHKITFVFFQCKQLTRLTDF